MCASSKTVCHGILNLFAHFMEHAKRTAWVVKILKNPDVNVTSCLIFCFFLISSYLPY